MQVVDVAYTWMWGRNGGEVRMSKKKSLDPPWSQALFIRKVFFHLWKEIYFTLLV